jgi:predicted kinase
MSKLIVLQGPPCSGKSTWAKNYIKGRENECIIVSRDAIRLAMCGGDVTTMFQGMKQDREDIVTQTETILIEQGLSKGYEALLPRM